MCCTACIAAGKNGGARRHRFAGIESGFQRQPEPGEVGRIDLHDADVNGMTGLEQLRRDLDRDVAGGGSAARPRGIVVDRERLKSALGSGDRRQGGRRDRRPATQRELTERANAEWIGMSWS